MTDEQAANAVTYLQLDPLAYRNYGVYWWWVKGELKRHGHTVAELRHLGDEHDPSCDKYLAGKSPAQITTEALTEQFGNATHNHRCDRVWTPDGEAYYVLDRDAE